MNDDDLRKALSASENHFIEIVLKYFTKPLVLNTFTPAPHIKGILAKESAAIGLGDGYDKLAELAVLEHNVDVDVLNFAYSSSIFAFHQAILIILDFAKEAEASKTSPANQSATSSKSTQKATDNTSTNMEILPI